METLFDKYSGTSTAFSGSSMTDSNADWGIDEYVGWFLKVQNDYYKIISNTTTKLTILNYAPIANYPYEISFISREYLGKIESDISNITKIPDVLLEKKYEQTNIDFSNKVIAYLKKLYTKDFNPTEYIFNMDVLQRPFAYYMLFLIYSDLSIHRDSQDEYKKEDYFNQYNYLYKDALALIKIDYNKDGVEDTDEIQQSASTMIYGAR